MKKDNKRRYFLHKKIKEFCDIDTRQRQINITDGFIESLTEDQCLFLFELRDTFGYNLQYTIE